MINQTREIAATRIAIVGICVTLAGLYLTLLPPKSRYPDVPLSGESSAGNGAFRTGLGIAGIGMAIVASVVVYVIFNHLVESTSRKSIKRSGVRINTRLAQDEALNLMFPDKFDADI